MFLWASLGAAKVRAGNDLGTPVTKVLEGWNWCCDPGLICDLQVFATGFSEHFSSGPSLGRPRREQAMTLAPLSQKYLKVGTDAVILVSPVICKSLQQASVKTYPLGLPWGTLVTKALEGWDWCCDFGPICDLQVFATGFSKNFSSGPSLGHPCHKGT